MKDEQMFEACVEFIRRLACMYGDPMESRRLLVNNMLDVMANLYYIAINPKE